MEHKHPETIEMEDMERELEGTATVSDSPEFDLLDAKYHTKCHDCGRFLKKEFWVNKDHKWKGHALCTECFDLYDPPEY